MTRIASLLTLLVTVLLSLLPAAPAQAQRDRVFVASYGSDSNPCTYGSPCKTFQQAVSVVAVGGEVTAIDSAGFGPISITQSVTITSPNGVEAGVVPGNNTDAIDIDGSNLTVVLRGLTLQGNGVGGYGVWFLASGELEMIGCKVRNFYYDGILVDANGATSVLIKDTIVSGNVQNQQYGIVFNTYFSASSPITAALDEVTVNNNYGGVFAYAGEAPTELQISNSHIDNNNVYGVLLEGTGGAAVTSAVLKNVTINQTDTDIELHGNSSLWLSGVTQSAAPGFDAFAGIANAGNNDAVYSDGTNHFMTNNNGVTLQSWPTN
jgi:hypothetical protein